MERYLGQPLLQLARYSLRRYDHHELKYSVLFAISSDKYGNYWYMYVFPRFIQEVACTQIRYPILLNLEVETQHFRWLKLLLVVYHLLWHDIAQSYIGLDYWDQTCWWLWKAYNDNWISFREAYFLYLSKYNKTLSNILYCITSCFDCL